MKENRLLIVIDQPAQAIFDFTLDPSNTSKWIDGIAIEETNEWPPKPGTIYRNRGAGSDWSQYKLIEIDEGKTFVLQSQDDINFYVRYSFRPIDENSTEFEYFEWVDDGAIADPFTADGLKKLKQVIEA